MEQKISVPACCFLFFSNPIFLPSLFLSCFFWRFFLSLFSVSIFGRGDFCSCFLFNGLLYCFIFSRFKPKTKINIQTTKLNCVKMALAEELKKRVKIEIITINFKKKQRSLGKKKPIEMNRLLGKNQLS